MSAHNVCPLCGCRRRRGPNRIHETGECIMPSRLRRRAHLSSELHRRAADWDLPPALIERIMQRRAREQKYERAMACQEPDSMFSR